MGNARAALPCAALALPRAALPCAALALPSRGGAAHGQRRGSARAALPLRCPWPRGPLSLFLLLPVVGICLRVCFRRRVASALLLYRGAQCASTKDPRISTNDPRTSTGNPPTSIGHLSKTRWRICRTPTACPSISTGNPPTSTKGPQTSTRDPRRYIENR